MRLFLFGRALLKKCRNHAKFLDSREYFESPAIEWDPPGMKKEALKFEVQLRLKLIVDMSRNRTACFAAIRSLMSTGTELPVRDSEVYFEVDK